MKKVNVLSVFHLHALLVILMIPRSALSALILLFSHKMVLVFVKVSSCSPTMDHAATVIRLQNTFFKKLVSTARKNLVNLFVSVRLKTSELTCMENVRSAMLLDVNHAGPANLISVKNVWMKMQFYGRENVSVH